MASDEYLEMKVARMWAKIHRLRDACEYALKETGDEPVGEISIYARQKMADAVAFSKQ